MVNILQVLGLDNGNLNDKDYNIKKIQGLDLIYLLKGLR